MNEEESYYNNVLEYKDYVNWIEMPQQGPYIHIHLMKNKNVIEMSKIFTYTLKPRQRISFSYNIGDTFHIKKHNKPIKLYDYNKEIDKNRKILAGALASNIIFIENMSNNFCKFEVEFGFLCSDYIMKIRNLGCYIFNDYKYFYGSIHPINKELHVKKFKKIVFEKTKKYPGKYGWHIHEKCDN